MIVAHMIQIAVANGGRVCVGRQRHDGAWEFSDHGRYALDMMCVQNESIGRLTPDPDDPYQKKERSAQMFFRVFRYVIEQVKQDGMQSTAIRVGPDNFVDET